MPNGLEDAPTQSQTKANLVEKQRPKRGVREDEGELREVVDLLNERGDNRDQRAAGKFGRGQEDELDLEKEIPEADESLDYSNNPILRKDDQEDHIGGGPQEDPVVSDQKQDCAGGEDPEVHVGEEEMRQGSELKPGENLADENDQPKENGASDNDGEEQNKENELRVEGEEGKNLEDQENGHDQPQEQAADGKDVEEQHEEKELIADGEEGREGIDGVEEKNLENQEDGQEALQNEEVNNDAKENEQEEGERISNHSNNNE